MNYPKFFDQIETITLQDPLSEFLGTFEEGLIDFSYLDVVKSAGHSCPTVAGAYLCTLKALKALYPNETPQRGAIKVEFSQTQTEGVAGVIGSVIANITGATTDYGFKGIETYFNRTNLMAFDQNIESSVKFTRTDTGASIEVNYNPHAIPPQAKQQALMQKIMQGIATPKDKQLFGEVWQIRVEAIFANIDSVITL